jgi:diacylglycerol kinase family enzyme
MRATLLHNPAAGEDPVASDVLVADLRSAGIEPTYIHVHRGELALPDDLGELVVVAGGDGTVGRVAKGLAGRGVPLAILAIGTANNVARALGQLGGMRQLAAEWQKGVRVPFDLGVARRAGRSARFIESFGGGAFAAMIAGGEARGPPDRAGLSGNRIDRGLMMLRDAIATVPCRRWQMHIDEEELEGEFLFVEAMNIPYLGSGVPVAPRADPTDGWLDVVLATARDRVGLVEHLDARLKGLSASPDLAVRRARRVRLELAVGDVHADDEVWARVAEEEPDRAVEIAVEHGALEVVAPR